MFADKNVDGLSYVLRLMFQMVQCGTKHLEESFVSSLYYCSRTLNNGLQLKIGKYFMITFLI